MAQTNLPSNFLLSLRNGDVKINYDDNPSIRFSADSETRIIDIIDLPIKLSTRTGFLKKLKEGKTLARELKNNGVTLDVKFQGKLVLRLGKKAKPKLSKVVTLSNDIEISDVKTLLKLEKSL